MLMKWVSVSIWYWNVSGYRMSADMGRRRGRPCGDNTHWRADTRKWEESYNTSLTNWDGQENLFIHIQTLNIPADIDTLYPVAIIIILKIILFEHKNTIVLVIFAVITVLSSGLFPFIKVSIVQYMAVQGLEVRGGVWMLVFYCLVVKRVVGQV